MFYCKQLFLHRYEEHNSCWVIRMTMRLVVIPHHKVTHPLMMKMRIGVGAKSSKLLVRCVLREVWAVWCHCGGILFFSMLLFGIPLWSFVCFLSSVGWQSAWRCKPRLEGQADWKARGAFALLLAVHQREEDTGEDQDIIWRWKSSRGKWLPWLDEAKYVLSQGLQSGGMACK